MFYVKTTLKRSNYMNQVLENIYARRSVRKFTEQTVSKQQLEALVGAGIHAPSGMNKQLWHFSAVQNRQLLSSLAKTVGEILGREGYDFYSPNALILVSNHRDNPHGEADCACALQNIFLAAQSLGLGSVWINQFRGICDDPRLRPLLSKAKVPEDHIIWGAAAIGYPRHPYNQSHRDTEGKIDIIL